MSFGSKITKLGLLSFAVVAGLAVVAAPTTSAARYTDGLSWSKCSGRTTQKKVSIGKGTMWIYRCSNGYVFTHVKATKKGHHTASIVRKSSKYAPYAQEVRGTNGYVATSDMLGVIKGSCYVARGYISGYGAKSVEFCYR